MQSKLLWFSLAYASQCPGRFAAGIADEADGWYGRIDLGATPPDAVAPAVSITAPAAAATVSGSVSLTVTAADNVGVTSVEFLAGATSLGSSTPAPFSVTWNTVRQSPVNGAALGIAESEGGITQG